MVKRRWQLSALIAFVAAMGAVVVLAQACGGGSAGVDVTLPTSAAGSETPVPRERFPPGDMPDITPGAGPPGQALFIGGDSEEFAAFLGIPLEQLESELNAEDATPASVAEAHGRTREELETFFMEQLQANLDEAVAAGTMSQEVADDMFERQAFRIDDIIDGNMPSGVPGGAPSGQ